MDVEQSRAVANEILLNEGDHNSEIILKTRPTVQTLFDWACEAKPEYRMLVLLGGFGMGKSTTV